MELHSIEDSIYNYPLLLLNIKNKKIIESIDNYLPYSIGIEIECDWLKRIGNEHIFKEIPNIIEVNCDVLEKRFRIPNGLNGLICLYNICEKLKKVCSLNPGSGIHYHIDMTDFFHIVNQEFIVKNKEYILKELDEWMYKGTYNSRSVYINNMAWVRFQTDFKTMEIRIGEMTFDYSLMIKRIIHSCKIVKTLKDLSYLTIEEVKIHKLQNELKELQTNNTTKIVNNIENIIKNREINLI